MSYQDQEKTAGQFNQNGVLVIRELDENGFLATIYEGQGPQDLTRRNAKSASYSSGAGTGSFASLLPRAREVLVGGSGIKDLAQSLINVFLPTGYPHSVTSDYIDYQIYDSVQAFSSSIASLFANRCVLTAVGVGDEDATSTSALFMKIIQETVGRMGTIVFAWQYGSTLEPECKKYRYMADLVNDSATIFDCLSPMFPASKNTKIVLLCMSGLLRSICGVMAGGSRAALTQHFTDPDRGSIADVNAKDQSQETVITLLGMLTGSVLVKIVQGEGLEMWVTVILLLMLHLYTNYNAVSSVIIRTLNRQRTNIVFSDAISSLVEIEQAFASPDEPLAKTAGEEPDKVSDPQGRSVSRLLTTPQRASARERILEPDGVLRWYSKGSDVVIGRAVYTGFQSVVDLLPSSVTLGQVLAACNTRDTGYILFYTAAGESPQIKICLLSTRSRNSDVRGWVHALLIAHKLSQAQATDPCELITETAGTVARLFDELRIETALRHCGWELDRYAVQSHPTPTITLSQEAYEGDYEA